MHDRLCVGVHLRWRFNRSRKEYRAFQRPQKGARKRCAQGKHRECVAEGACFCFVFRTRKRMQPGLTWISASPLFFSLVVSILILGCGRRERRSGTADDVRGACAWLCRTYHVCMPLRLTLPSPHPPPFFCGVLTRERESLTDNGNRTLHQLREILNDHK